MQNTLHLRSGDDRPAAIYPKTFPPHLKLLMLGPHPDDFDAIGVTLRCFGDNGNPLHAGVVRTGSGVLDKYAPGLTWAKKADIREREQRSSLRFFGLPDADVTFFSLDNDDDEGQLRESPSNLATLAAFVNEKNARYARGPTTPLLSTAAITNTW